MMVRILVLLIAALLFPAAGNDLKFRPQFSEVWLMKSVFGEDKIEGQRRKNR